MKELLVILVTYREAGENCFSTFPVPWAADKDLGYSETYDQAYTHLSETDKLRDLWEVSIEVFGPFELPGGLVGDPQVKCQTCSSVLPPTELETVPAHFPFTAKEWKCCGRCAEHIKRTGQVPSTPTAGAK